LLCELARVAPGRFGQLHGDIARDVTVRGDFGALKRDGLLTFWQQFAHGGFDMGDELFLLPGEHKANSFRGSSQNDTVNSGSPAGDGSVGRESAQLRRPSEGVLEPLRIACHVYCAHALSLRSAPVRSPGDKPFHLLSRSASQPAIAVLIRE